MMMIMEICADSAENENFLPIDGDFSPKSIMLQYFRGVSFYEMDILNFLCVDRPDLGAP